MICLGLQHVACLPVYGKLFHGDAGSTTSTSKAGGAHAVPRTKRKELKEEVRGSSVLVLTSLCNEGNFGYEALLHF